MTNPSTSPGAWLRRLLRLLAVLITAAILVPAAALLVLDDADYKRILEWATDTFLDSELEITGPFSVTLSNGVHVSAGDIRLQAHDGTYALTTQAFSTRFRVISVLSGAFIIDDLVLTDASLKLNESADPDSGGPDAKKGLPWKPRAQPVRVV